MRRRNLKFLSICSLLFLGTSLVSCDFPFQGEQAKYGLVYLANNGLFDHGKVSLSSYGNIKVGTTINITATPDTGYILDYLTLNNNKLNGFTFEVVKGDNVVNAYFIEQQEAEYGSVYLANNGLFDHGKVSLSSYGNIKVGTTINITATPDTGYILDYLTLNNNKLNGFTFEVVKGDNVVNAYFIEQQEAEYGSVYLANNGLFDHGKVSLSSYGNIKVGTTINITATPDTGYILDYLTLNNNKLNGFTFEVVKGDNVVNAYFIEQQEDTSEPISIDLPKGEIIPGQGSVLKTNYTLIDAETYYKDIDFSASKDLLEENLRNLVSNHKILSYGDARYTMLYTEESIATPGKILGLYDSKLFEPEWDQGATYNREHVWCRNHLKIDGKTISTNNSTKGIGSDLHNLKPLTSSLNSSRGDDFFGNENDGSSYFYPNYSGNIDYRGDVARICFYMALRYEKLTLTDNLSGDTSTSFGLLSRLLEWNKLDPVDAFELRRTNRVYEYQGNRNPFVDYPYTLADKLFG